MGLDLDWLIPHQASLRIIEATAKRLEMTGEMTKMPRNLATSFANCRMGEAIRKPKHAQHPDHGRLRPCTLP